MKVGVIGAGSMGQNHIRVLSEIADVVGIADPDIKVASGLANRFNVSYFTSHPALLKEKGLEAVVVATPTHLHFPVAKAAIEYGLSVLVEKPLCDNSGDAQSLVDLAKSAGVTLAVGHVERHNPVVGAAKRHLESGVYGALISAAARRVSSFPTRVRDVGVIMDLGIHDIDVLRYLIGSKVVSVFALGGRQRHEKFEDYANLLLDFENGVTGSVEVNWMTPMKVRKLALTCSEKYVELDYTGQFLVESSAKLIEHDHFNLYQVPFEYDIRQISLQKQEPLRRELEDFLQAIKEGRRPLVDGQDAVETLRVAEAALDSLRSGKVAQIN